MPSCCLALGPENGGILQPIPLGDENQIVFGPKSLKCTGEIEDGETVLRLHLVRHRTFYGEGCPDPRTVVRLRPPCIQENMRLVNFAPIFLICGVSVTRAKAAKNHSAKVLTEPAMGFSTTFPQLVVA